jgi:hypothetical protein
MEQIMLRTLQWRIAHGPSPISFVQLYLTFLQLHVESTFTNRGLFEALQVHAQYQVEAAAIDYHLVTQRSPSIIALAAVWNALECHLHCGRTVQKWQHRLIQQLSATQNKDSMKMQLWSRQLDKLPQLQLRLCNLLNTAVPSSRNTADQQEQQHLEQRQASADYDDWDDNDCESMGGEESSTLSKQYSQSSTLGDDDVREDNDKLVDETEVNDSDDDTSMQQSLFPSPVSVMANQHMSANYTHSNMADKATSTIMSGAEEHCCATSVEKHQEKEPYHYALSFLRSFFIC